ncbi:hypothetical protein, partial [Rhodococcus sp. Chr-9]
DVLVGALRRPYGVQKSSRHAEGERRLLHTRGRCRPVIRCRPSTAHRRA